MRGVVLSEATSLEFKGFGCGSTIAIPCAEFSGNYWVCEGIVRSTVSNFSTSHASMRARLFAATGPEQISCCQAFESQERRESQIPYRKRSKLQRLTLKVLMPSSPIMYPYRTTSQNLTRTLYTTCHSFCLLLYGFYVLIRR